MKGLIIKDFYSIWARLRMFALICVAFLIGYIFTDNYFFKVYPCIFISTAAISLIAYDEAEKWNFYSMTMPCSRAMNVSAKYIISVIITLVSTGSVTAVDIGKMISKGNFSPIEALTTFVFLVCISLLPFSLMTPPVFKLGAEKGRLFYLILIGAFAGSSAFFSAQDLQIQNHYIFIMFGATIVIYALSWLISIALYKNKELK